MAAVETYIFLSVSESLRALRPIFKERLRTGTGFGTGTGTETSPGPGPGHSKTKIVIRLLHRFNQE